RSISSCRQRSPSLPARRTGTCWCVLAPWKTSVTLWFRRRSASMKTVVAHTATAWWWIAGAASWTYCRPARAPRSARSTWNARRASGVNSPPLNTRYCDATEVEMPANADNLSLAKQVILAPGGLDEGRLDRTLGLVMDHAIDA